MNFTTTWNTAVKRRFRAGVDRGVAYVNGIGEAWSGLTSVTIDGPDGEFTTRYIDGIPFYIAASPSDTTGSIEAFTYPDNVESCLGFVRPDGPTGIIVPGQTPTALSMVYREMIGSPSGLFDDYVIHIIFNLKLQDSGRSNTTFTETPEPNTFSWAFATVPELSTDYRPSAHFKVDTRTTPRHLVEDLEKSLYGWEGSDPELPTIETIRPLLVS